MFSYRYVREWLAIVVTGKIVTYSRESNTYFLPRNYIPLLTSGKHNISILNRMMLRLGESHGKVSECFKKGGGIPYTNYAWFHTWMSELSSKKHEVDLVSHFVPSVEGVVTRSYLILHTYFYLPLPSIEIQPSLE